jgi:hypothetical protein
MIRHPNPCRNCPYRHPICHDDCTHGYREYRADMDEAARQRKIWREVQDVRGQQVVKRIRETQLQRKKQGK